MKKSLSLIIVALMLGLFMCQNNSSYGKGREELRKTVEASDLIIRASLFKVEGDDANEQGCLLHVTVTHVLKGDDGVRKKQLPIYAEGKIKVDIITTAKQQTMNEGIWLLKWNEGKKVYMLHAANSFQPVSMDNKVRSYIGDVNPPAPKPVAKGGDEALREVVKKSQLIARGYFQKVIAGKADDEAGCMFTVTIKTVHKGDAGYKDKEIQVYGEGKNKIDVITLARQRNMGEGVWLLQYNAEKKHFFIHSRNSYRPVGDSDEIRRYIAEGGGSTPAPAPADNPKPANEPKRPTVDVFPTDDNQVAEGRVKLTLEADSNLWKPGQTTRVTMHFENVGNGPVQLCTDYPYLAQCIRLYVNGKLTDRVRKVSPPPPQNPTHSHHKIQKGETFDITGVFKVEADKAVIHDVFLDLSGVTNFELRAAYDWNYQGSCPAQKNAMPAAKGPIVSVNSVKLQYAK